jgi:hypothetical protein
MPALAIIVMLFSTIPLSFSQSDRVTETSRNGSPEENPSRHIVPAAGCEKARQIDGLRLTITATSVGIVNDVRRMIGEALVAVDRAARQAMA